MSSPIPQPGASILQGSMPQPLFSAGISETAIPVADVQASVDFYTQVVGLVLEVQSPDGAFLWAGPPSAKQRLILASRAYLSSDRGPVASMKKDLSWGHSHFAFHVPRANVDAAVGHIRRSGITVSGPIPFPTMNNAISYYFRDPDGHLVELWSPE